jgi:hypothetical protein
MGFLGKLLGTDKPKHPPLDPASPIAARLAQSAAVLEPFVKKVSGAMDFIPGDRAIYVYIGAPPETFGVVWFEGTEEHNFKTLMKAKKLTDRQMKTISGHLGEAWSKHKDEPRFEHVIGGKTVVVIGSAAMEADLLKIIHETD